MSVEYYKINVEIKTRNPSDPTYPKYRTVSEHILNAKDWSETLKIIQHFGTCKPGKHLEGFSFQRCYTDNINKIPLSSLLDVQARGGITAILNEKYQSDDEDSGYGDVY